MDELAFRTTVEGIVTAYEQAEASIRQGCALVAGAEKRLNDILKLGDLYGGVQFLPTRADVNFKDPTEHITELRRQVWANIVARLEIQRMLSIAKSKELDAWLSSKTVEPITQETVMGLFRYYIEKLPEMLSEAIGEVYEFLRPERSRYKTNTEYELGSRVILSAWVEPGIMAKYRPRSWARPRYVALENVFSALDGQGSVGKSYFSELEREVERTVNDRGETRYFRFRACLNGNLHLEFKRPDLVDKFNRMAGGKRLRAG